MGITQIRGSAGEKLAESYLELTGHEVLARNVRLGGVEVDRVVRDGDVVVLVEVKTRSRRDYGGAVAAVDARKRQRLMRAVRAVSRRHRFVRVDVVTVEPEDDGIRIRHYRNAVTE
jgi:putative endonuclease